MMTRSLAVLAVAIAALSFVLQAHAQQSPFTKGAATVSLSVTAASSSISLGITSTGGVQDVWVCNTGAATAYIAFGDSTVAATTGDIPLPSGLCGNLSPRGSTYIAAIAAASATTTVLAIPGNGILFGSGGGGGGSGGSGTLYVTTPTFSNGTITTTNTWQSLLTTDALRRSCQAQNQGTHTMFFQVTSANTAPTGTAAAVQVAAGQTVVCNDYIGDVMQGYVWITGTAADPYQVTSFH